MENPATVTPAAPVAFARPPLTQQWLDLRFPHWAGEPEVVAPLLPDETVPHTHDGVTHAGLVAFRMRRAGRPGLPGQGHSGFSPHPAPAGAAAPDTP